MCSTDACRGAFSVLISFDVDIRGKEHQSANKPSLKRQPHTHTHTMPHTRHRVLNRRVLFLLSVILIFRSALMVIGLAAAAYGAYQKDIAPLYIAGGCFALLLFLQVIHSIESTKVVCPNCRSQILQVNKCSKHKESKKMLGSHSLRVAVQVLFTNRFCCQYCNQIYQWRGKRK